LTYTVHVNGLLMFAPVASLTLASIPVKNQVSPGSTVPTEDVARVVVATRAGSGVGVGVGVGAGGGVGVEVGVGAGGVTVGRFGMASITSILAPWRSVRPAQ